MPAATVRRLLARGMVAGLIAGLLAFAVAYLVGEGPVSDSIALEHSASAPAAHHDHDHGTAEAAAPDQNGGDEEDLVSRTLQSTAGLATGVLVYGVALGGIGSLAFCFALGRIGRLSPRATAALVAAGAFTTVYLVPFLKYPATPPAVGNPDTVGQRTTLFFLMIALSVLLGVAAVIVGRRLAPRLGTWNATVAAGACYVAVMAVLFAVLPDNGDAVKESFPSALLWDFRLASIGIQAALWTAFGLLFGALAQRLLVPPTAAAATTEPVPATAA
ncbi:CbtA family protein [Kitasatospora sp. NPDC004799]|uniref:CbtA family protein n=1 Tax=Kitasatospora sp. NPDC004799 TaxID=3154460 RepID=UPI0033B695B0